MAKIDTVILDLDGTLLDTLQDLHTSVNYALERYGLPLRSEQDIRAFLGNGIEQLVKLSVPADTQPHEFSGVFICFKEHYMQHCLDKTAPYKGIDELLDALRAGGYKLAIVSNKLHSAVEELNERFFKRNIDVAIGESAGVKRKPAPDTVEKALEMLNSKPENAIYVGDSEVDMMTAKNAGIPCISVTWGFRDRDFLIKRGATDIVDTTHDLLIRIKALS